MHTLRAMGALALAYQCQMTAPVIGNELRRPRPRRMLAVFSVALGTAWALYMAIGISGYLTFGSNVQHNLLDSYDATNPLLSFARVGLAIVVISSYPIQVTVTRASVRSLARLCFHVGASDDDEAGESPSE